MRSLVISPLGCARDEIDQDGRVHALTIPGV
jgi:hypothetical protein